VNHGGNFRLCYNSERKKKQWLTQKCRREVPKWPHQFGKKKERAKSHNLQFHYNERKRGKRTLVYQEKFRVKKENKGKTGSTAQQQDAGGGGEKMREHRGTRRKGGKIQENYVQRGGGEEKKVNSLGDEWKEGWGEIRAGRNDQTD